MGRFSGWTLQKIRAFATHDVAPDDATYRELEAEVEGRIARRQTQGKRPKPEQLALLDEIRARVVAPPTIPPRVVAPAESTDGELLRLRRETDLWRALYRHRSEHLARWGMTDTLPDEMIRQIVRLWREMLADGFADAVRTAERLEADERHMYAHVDAPEG